MSKPLIRIYHPYWDWEEVDANMWGSVSDKAKFLELAIEFTGDHKLYGRFMMRVANEWPVSCEHNLSNITQNRKAWIGHAAVALAIGCPEDITRKAWGYLSQEQQDLANGVAQQAIEHWENKQCQNEA